ncbi:MAG: phosphopantetheine-binding protein, partial [Planctomycetota bacterium]
DEGAAGDPLPLRPLPERRVGEVLVQGPSVAAGYWRRPEETARLFAATVEGHAGVLLRTGDLGFLYGGELFITGRLKDVIILRGRNYYPQDIEQTAQAAHPDVLPGAAFAVEANQASADALHAVAPRLVLVHQIARTCREAARPAVVEAIRRAVLAEHEVAPDAVVLIRQSSLPVTSSGKVQRGLCRQQYTAGELRVLHAWQAGVAAQEGDRPNAHRAPDLAGLPAADAAERIEDWMLAWLVSHVGLDATRADRDRPFAELGLDSLTAVELAGELERAFGVPLPPVVAWNYPTPVAMARYLAEQTLAEQKLAEQEPAEQAAGAPIGPVGAGVADPVVAAPAAGGQLEALLADIENLTDEQAARLLAAEDLPGDDSAGDAAANDAANNAAGDGPREQN